MGNYEYLVQKRQKTSCFMRIIIMYVGHDRSKDFVTTFAGSSKMLALRANCVSRCDHPCWFIQLKFDENCELCRSLSWLQKQLTFKRNHEFFVWTHFAGILLIVIMIIGFHKFMENYDFLCSETYRVFRKSRPLLQR